MTDSSEGENRSTGEERERSPVTLSSWLDARTPPAPPHLVDRLAEIVGSEAMERAPDASVLLDRGISTLRSALSDRDGALDLLAADALITYSMEAAAEHCASLEDTAAEAVERIARDTA